MALPALPGYGELVPARKRDNAFTVLATRAKYVGMQIEAEEYITDRVIDALDHIVDYAQMKAGDNEIKGRLVGRAVLRASDKLDRLQQGF